MSRCHLSPWTSRCRTRRQSLLLLLEENLLLNLLLLSDLRGGGNLGRLPVEGDLRLLEVATSVYEERMLADVFKKKYKNRQNSISSILGGGATRDDQDRFSVGVLRARRAAKVGNRVTAWDFPRPGRTTRFNCRR